MKLDAQRSDLFEVAFGISPDGMIIAEHPSGLIVAANEIVESQTGYAPEELIGRSVSEHFELDDAEWEAMVDALDRKGRFRDVRVDARVKDGTTMSARVSSQLFHMDGRAYALSVARDETDLQRAIDALRDSESRYRALVEAQSEFIVRWLPGGARTFVNDAYCRYFGVSKTDLEGSDFWPLIDEGDRDRVRARIAALTPEDPVSVGTHRVARPDGSTGWHEWTDRAFFDADGAVQSYVSVGRDVTALFEAREREELLRAAWTQSPALTTVAAADGRILFVNEQAYAAAGFENPERMVGLQAGSAAKRSSVRDADGNLLEIDDFPLRRALRGETVRAQEIRFRFDAGAERWGLNNAAPVLDAEGRVVAAVSVTQDITALKEEEAARAASERRYRSFFEQVAAGAATITLDGVLTSVNPALQELLGADEAALLGASGLDFLVPEGAREATELFEEFRRGTRDRVWREGRVLRRGVPLWVHVSAALVRDDAGTPNHLVVLVQDISEMKRLERELLDVASAERNRLGRDLHDGLSQQLSGGGLLAAALERRVAGDEDLVELVQEIGRVFRDAHREARFLARGMFSIPVDEDLGPALEELANSARQLYRIEVDIDLDEPVPVADEIAATHLYQICREAVTNAVRHGRAGNIAISLRSDDARIRMVVHDDGSGIPSERERREGVGLRSMRSRARALGGALEIRADKTGGTTIVCEVDRDAR